MGDAKITIDKRIIDAQTGTTVMECLVEAGLFLRSDCGGRGRCGKCLVRVAGPDSQGLSEPDETEEKILGAKDKASPYRLACRTRVLGAVSLSIPDESRLQREAAQKGAPVLLSRFESYGRASSRRPAGARGVAVDIGTTTIAVYLCDLARSTVVASTSVRNPQSIFGDDVISRLGAVREDASALLRLQRMAVSAVDWAVSTLCSQSGVDLESITDAVCVGNSVMLHLFLGEDPSSIGFYPYTPRFVKAMDLSADTVGMRSCSRARLRTLPLISGYLGADIVAAALATDLAHAAPGTMLVDAGTNGEIIFMTEEGLAATSCATGPAFEGATIRHGMQAAPGAIDAVRFSPETGRLACRVIQSGQGKPRPAAGICGSGVISAVAELLRAGVILGTGNFDIACGFSSLRRGENGIQEFVIAPAEPDGSGHDIVLTQGDVRAVQLAKGALRTGIEILCRSGRMERPCKVFLAGAFGNFIDREDALRIGMFPQMDVNDIEVVGNAAGAGAVLALLHEELFERAAQMAQSTRVLDLASHKDFLKTFVDALSF